MLGNTLIFITTFIWLQQQFKMEKAYLNKHAADHKKKIIVFSYGDINAPLKKSNHCTCFKLV